MNQAALEEDERKTQIRASSKPSFFLKVKRFFDETLPYKISDSIIKNWPSEKELSLQEKKDLLRRFGYTVIDNNESS